MAVSRFGVPTVSLASVFEYQVDPAAAEAFEAVYGRGTEMLRSADGYYLVIDRWDSEADYDAFLTAHADEYGSRNQDASRLWLRERILGRFETA